MDEDEEGRPNKDAKGLPIRVPDGFAAGVEVEGRGGRGGLLRRG